MIIKVKIKNAGIPYEYISSRNIKVGDTVIVKTYRNGTGVEGIVVETDVEKTTNKKLKRARKK